MTAFDTDVAALEAAVRGFGQIMKRPQQWTQVVAQSGVTLDRPAAVILQTLVAHQPTKLRVQDLAQYLGIEPPSVTRKTQQLEEAGLLKRMTDTSDRRATSLVVTTAGKRAADKLWQAHRQIMHDALVSWPAAERHQFVTLFERFTNDMTRLASSHVVVKKKG